MISIIMFCLGLLSLLWLINEIYEYSKYRKETKESYIMFIKEQKSIKRQLKIRKELYKMITDVYNLSEEELQKRKDEYAKKNF